MEHDPVYKNMEEDTERMIELVKNNPKKSNSELAKELIKQQK